MSVSGKALIAIVIYTLIQFLPVSLKAQEDPHRKKFYVGMDMGAGWLTYSQNNQPDNYTARYALALYGGYQPFQWLRIGINVNGWLIEPFGNFYDEPEKGVSISNTNGEILFLPLKQNLFFRLQGGHSTYTNHHPGNYNASGTNLKVGIGYELTLASHWVLPISIQYGTGKFKDVNYPGIAVVNQNFDVIELLVGITFR